MSLVWLDTAVFYTNQPVNMQQTPAQIGTQGQLWKMEEKPWVVIAHNEKTSSEKENKGTVNFLGKK